MRTTKSLIYAIMLLSIIMSFIVSCGGKKLTVRYDMTAEASYEEGLKLYNQGDYKNAIEYFLNVITFNPSSHVSDDAQFYIAMSFFKMNKYEDAIAEFELLISNYGRSEYVDDAYYYIGLSYLQLSPPYYLDQELTNKAIENFNMVIQNFEYSNVISEAKEALSRARNKLAEKQFNILKFYMGRREYKSVIIYSGIMKSEYFDTIWVDDAIYIGALAMFKLGQYNEARDEINRFIERYPNSNYINNAKNLLENINKVEKIE
ncbi:MAG: outer membrane protein assembly factor BamD [bacterium]